MLRINVEETAYALKQSVSIFDVLDHFGVRYNTQGYHISCPIHADSTPSLKIYNGDSPDGSFACFGCHAGGDAISLFAKMEQLERIPAMYKMSDVFKVQLVTRAPPTRQLEKAKSLNQNFRNQVSEAADNLKVEKYFKATEQSLIEASRNIRFITKSQEIYQAQEFFMIEFWDLYDGMKSYVLSQSLKQRISALTLVENLRSFSTKVYQSFEFLNNLDLDNTLDKTRNEFLEVFAKALRLRLYT